MKPPRVPPTQGNGKPPEEVAVQLPSKITRHVYPTSGFRVGGMELIPDAEFTIGGETPTVILFQTGDGTEFHIFCFNAEGKRHLIDQLTGGIQIAQPGDLPA